MEKHLLNLAGEYRVCANGSTNRESMLSVLQFHFLKKSDVGIASR